MAKDPAVLFYVQDFLIGSSLLTPLQKGHYITLLCYQQQSESGSLSIDEIKTLMGIDFLKQWPVLKKKFQEDDKGFYNARMRSEMSRRKVYSDSRRNNRLAKVPPKDDHMSGHMLEDISKDVSNHMNKHVENHMGVHMETAIETETQKGVQGEKLDFSGNLIYDVEKDLLNNQIAFENICMKARRDASTAKNSLRKFHLWITKKNEYPGSRKALHAGFEYWLMNEKNYSQDEPQPTNATKNAIEQKSQSILDDVEKGR